MQKRLHRALKGLILSTSIFFGACKLPEIFPNLFDNTSYNLSNFVEKTLGRGYERPGGLSTSREYSKNATKQLAKKTDITNVFFLEKPTYKTLEDENGESYRSFVKKPSIYQLPENSLVYEFPEEDVNDFTETDSSECLDENGNFLYDSDGKMIRRPRGLTLESVVLNDNSMVISSNLSKKLFRVYNLDSKSQKETYKDDDELIFTTGMILGSDDKIYLVQPPLYKRDISDPSLFVTERAKRVLSIDINDLKKTLNLETELPDIFYLGNSMGVPNNRGKYSGLPCEIGEQLKIIENSAEGKARNGIDFYVSDLMEMKIYQLAKLKDGYDISVFNEDLSYPPTSMFVDKAGNLFITSSPVFQRKVMSDGKNDRLENELLEYPKVVRITPDSEEVVYTLPLNFDFSNETLFGKETSQKGSLFSGVFSMSSLLSEEDTNWDLLTVNSYDGTVESLHAVKE
jgi:hypothetical protein